MGASMSLHTRSTRKSVAKAAQENGTPSKTSTADTVTPSSARPNRGSRLAANTGAKITKQPPATPAATTAKPSNGVKKTATSAKQTPTQTSNTSTRSRRRDRRSTRATDQTPSQVKGSGGFVAQTNDKQSSPQRPNRPSNTVTLNVGRKSLETILAQQAKQKAQDDAANIAPPENDYHIEYDSEMYRNNYGLDGQMDGPTSPASMSTTTSTAARTSGRTRKPTIRALESFESEQRYRRLRAPSAKPSTADTTAHTGSTDTNMNSAESETRPTQKPSSQPPTSITLVPTPDISGLAKQIYELAAAAVADDFVSPPETEKWFKDLQQKFEEQPKEKETEPVGIAEPAGPAETLETSKLVKLTEPAEGSSPVEEEAEIEGSTPTNEAFLDNVQASAPWTDADGWVHTGQQNKHGEEFVIVGPKFEWYRPNYTYGDKSLPQPPARLRSYAQSEADRVFGYPPCIGDRNVPAEIKDFFLLENVPEERAKLKAKEAARARGIIVTRYMPLHEIELLISLYNNGHPPPPPVPAPENVAESKPTASTRKRRRADTTSTSKPSEPVETPKPKRRRQEAEDPTAAEPPAPEPGTEPAAEPSTEEPTSPEKKSLRITLTFGKNKYLLGQVVPSDSTTTTDQSKKRSHSEIEENTDTPEKTHSHDTRSPKIQKVSTPTAENTPNETAPTRNATQAMGPPSTPASKTAETKTDKPGSAEQFSTETTPGGRPRRRAAAALMAGFQVHAEDRARRAERARAAHARRKGTPLKNVTTALNEGPVESPSRPAVNYMNLD